MESGERRAPDGGRSKSRWVGRRARMHVLLLLAVMRLGPGVNSYPALHIPDGRAAGMLPLTQVRRDRSDL